ncbi:MAG TPA: potassium channel family protein [bacterium]|nr:potassium channel family protein [bacterium]
MTPVRLLVLAAGFLIVAVVLWDAFEAVVLPRRVARRLRLVVVILRLTWRFWGKAGMRRRAGPRRETFLSYYGPVSLILLLVVWAAGLIVGFAMMQWGLGSSLVDPQGRASFLSDLYFSGTNFFTIGLGDVSPRGWPARAITVIEGGTGFAFLALVIGYLPIFYQEFSRRETRVTMLDGWAGSPPTAGALLFRLGRDGSLPAVSTFLEEWELWCADMLESHLSYPILAYFRSQHSNQSWLAGITAVLDVCALILAGVEGAPRHAAQRTFAMARHTVVDLCQVFAVAPRAPAQDRMPVEDFPRLEAMLSRGGVTLTDGPKASVALAHLRHLYEPYVTALSALLLMPLPTWMPEPGARDNWERSPWR